jgi:hypothetical protein
MTTLVSLAWYKEKAEFQLLGQRLGVVNVQSFCTYLDALFGRMVAATTMRHLQYKLGREDGSELALENSGSPLREVIKMAIETDQLRGMGLAKVFIPSSSNGAYVVEVRNPIVKQTEGASGAFLSSYWAGALSGLLEKEMQVENVNYDQKQDVMSIQIKPKTIHPEI